MYFIFAVIAVTLSETKAKGREEHKESIVNGIRETIGKYDFVENMRNIKFKEFRLQTRV